MINSALTVLKQRKDKKLMINTIAIICLIEY
jgi:hypothetical protein